jgi:hypothetical protein
MSPAASQVLEAAMSLPESERAEVTARLQETIRGFATAEIAEEWEAEIADRLREIDDGTVELIPAEVVHAELRKKYGFFKG